MTGLLTNFSILLAQTATEKSFTMVNLALFMFFLVLMVMDARGKGRTVSNHIIANIVYTFAIITGIVLIIAVVLKK
ncbi:MAG: hypothetical protein RR334_00050 [Clostridia bacterium]